MEMGALVALLEPSSLRENPLPLSASHAQSQRFLRPVQALVTLAHLEQQLLPQDLQAVFQSFAPLVSLLREMRALLVLLEPSSLMANPLPQSACLAQWERFLRRMQALVTFARLDKLQPALEVLSAFQ